MSFARTGGTRSRVARVAAQAAGATVGMAVGALIPTTAGWVMPMAFTPARARRVGDRGALERAVLWTGARVGVSVGESTAVAILLRSPAHASWIPLTVAVFVRPEYGSVLVRSVRRLVGTLVGVADVAGLLAVTSAPVWITVVAALSLGLAAFGATRLYGLAVVGITGSALFSVALTLRGSRTRPWGLISGSRLRSRTH